MLLLNEQRVGGLAEWNFAALFKLTKRMIVRTRRVTTVDTAKLFSRG